MARHLLRLLRYLEVTGHFVVVSAYVRTYHNQLQDFLSRETQEVVDTEMHRLGYVRAESAGPWEEILRRGYVWTTRPRPPGRRWRRLATRV